MENSAVRGDGADDVSGGKYTNGKCRSKLECGPMPNVMATLPNIGGAICSTPQSLADAHYLSAVQ